MMKKQVIVIIAVMLAAAVLYLVWICIFSANENRHEYALPYVNGIFASTENDIISPSREYLLSLEEYDDNGVKSYKIVVKFGENKIISDEYFRARDTFIALWDDKKDRVWAYSGDLGTFFWDIHNEILVVHPYSDYKEEDVPQALKEAKPHMFNP